MTRTVLATVAAAIFATAYFLACWLWPFTACSVCSGTAKRRSPSGKAWRPCRHCRGDGYRLRTGRRVWLWMRGVGSDAR